jgi:6-phosphogluconate dehydrogenase
MGLNMSRRLMQRDHEIVGTSVNPDEIKSLEQDGGEGARDLEALTASLSMPRVIWLMVPEHVVDSVLGQLVPKLSAGDLIIDGGNSRFHDTLRRGDELAGKDIHLVDCGTSGGVWGLENGYNLMIGGSDDNFRTAEPLFRDLAPENGYLHTGPLGSGHYCKMIHNGIEYGMLQAMGEGFEILAKSRFHYDLRAVSDLWNQGSVIRSWLMELMERAFADDPRLSDIRGYVEDSGEGRWTVQEAIDLNVPAPALTLALQARFRSRQDDSFSAKTIAALRNQFGGHAVKESE